MKYTIVQINESTTVIIKCDGYRFYARILDSKLDKKTYELYYTEWTFLMEYKQSEFPFSSELADRIMEVIK